MCTAAGGGPRLWCGESGIKVHHPFLLFEEFVGGQGRMLVDRVDLGRSVAQVTSGGKGAEAVVEVVLLVHLGLGDDAGGEGDGQVGAAAGTVGRRAEQRVSPVALESRNTARKQKLPHRVTVESTTTYMVPGVDWIDSERVQVFAEIPVPVLPKLPAIFALGVGPELPVPNEFGEGGPREGVTGIQPVVGGAPELHGVAQVVSRRRVHRSHVETEVLRQNERVLRSHQNPRWNLSASPDSFSVVLVHLSESSANEAEF